ncbi:HotDog domain-containing protein [Trametes elegans]|nr:HotDog domain-containing protein [Trametes elegans]
MSSASTRDPGSAQAAVAVPGQRSPTRFIGDLSDEQRDSILKYADIILRGRGQYSQAVGSRLELTEVELYERERDGKTHIRMVFEIDTEEDMLNGLWNLHGGCTMFFVDVCSSIALASLALATNRKAGFVSQAINTVFHAPATVGARLSIVNHTIALGSRTVSARTEIWDTTNGRLVATGTHNQMEPSAPKL